ncbi:MAG: TPM domain-containing protein, partial [Verrucomicrobia bacterium]|nr:TPM domain-containing protein [Verrucomicrobiota bacterium]
MRIALAILGLLWGTWLRAAEVIPPAPKAYFNDYAGVVSARAASRLNETLADFERKTSSQILVAIYPKMQSDSSIEDYTVRVAESWKAGQKGRNNGAVLFVFVQDRRMRIEVGYGLEPVLTDALCKQIIEYEIKPRFRNGDFAGGLSAGVAAMIAAAQGEYKGTGRTVAEGLNRAPPQLVFLGLFVLAMGFVLIAAMARSRATVYGRGGRAVWGGWYGGGWGGGWTGGG